MRLSRQFQAKLFFLRKDFARAHTHTNTHTHTHTHTDTHTHTQAQSIFFSIFVLKKVNIQTCGLYETIYFLNVHLKLSLNHINWTLVSYDDIINLKNWTISKIYWKSVNFKKLVFNVLVVQWLWILIAIKCSYFV